MVAWVTPGGTPAAPRRNWSWLTNCRGDSSPNKTSSAGSAPI